MKNFFYILISVFILFSCKSKIDNTSYMQNIESIALQNSIKNSKNTIQFNDQLMIFVAAKDMDVVAPFNQNYNSSTINQYSLPNNNTLSSNQVVSQGPTYLVDTDGNINFPVIGKIHVLGISVDELSDKLKSQLSNFIINPIVTVKHVNYKITVLGEVNRQGEFIIPDANATIFNALGMAGDLTIYGKRENVLILRNINGQITKERLDLTDANFVNSPYFYLKQGDLIYVSANDTKQKTSRLDPNVGIYIAVASVILGLLTLIIRK